MEISKSEHLEEVLELYKQHNSSEVVARIVSEKYNVPLSGTLSRKIRKWASDEGLTKKHVVEIEETDIYKQAQEKKVNKDSKYFIITSAQNATPIHKTLWNNIKAYANYLEASIEVIPMRYKNPTSVFTDIPYEYWDEDVQPYLIANRHNIHKNLTVVGDIKIQPTASTPLTGMEGLTEEDSCIIGHTRQHFITVPTLDKQLPKFLCTTGSITEQNYTDSKSGKKGEFHHCFGFIVVEIVDEDTFYIRQVSADKDGSFCDLDFLVAKGKVTQTNCVEAMVLGDLHLGSTCEYSLMETFDMLDRFKPKTVVLHDVMDSKSVNHHESRNPFVALQKEQDGSWDMEEEISLVLDFIDELVDQHTVVCVKSNHDVFVDRFLEDVDWRKESNKYAYLKYAKLRADGELPNGILPYNIEQKFGKKVICLTEDDSYKVKNIELAVHGHIGANGSRGSAMQYKRLNTKLVTGHTHSPLRIDNLMTVGTLTNLRLGYNKGLSNWFNSNVIIQSNGKMQNLLIFKGKGYTTL